mmetsp:Transcript_365/g.883  ORF Transcript_365/g.883 Transcript_365/m.883 type:complete len:124 (+) Transcript_365:1128-1499(+)
MRLQDSKTKPNPDVMKFGNSKILYTKSGCLFAMCRPITVLSTHFAKTSSEHAYMLQSRHLSVRLGLPSVLHCLKEMGDVHYPCARIIRVSIDIIFASCHVPTDDGSASVMIGKTLHCIPLDYK